jgi:hypothetical protein
MTASETETQTHQLTPRDRACLIWIALQYAIRLDQLQRLLYRHTPEQDRHKLKPGTDHLSLDRTYELINKWLEMDLIEKKIILHGDKLWIWSTRAGLRTVQLAFNFNGAPSSIRLPHLYSINQVRLAVEAKRPHDIWKSERQIRKEIPAVVKGESVNSHASWEKMCTMRGISRAVFSRHGKETTHPTGRAFHGMSGISLTERANLQTVAQLLTVGQLMAFPPWRWATSGRQPGRQPGC